MSVKVTMNLWLVDFYQQPQTSHKKSMEHYNVKLFLVPIKHWCAIEMSRLRGSLRKRVHSTVFPHCVRAAYTHIHMKPKEKEWAVMLSSDIYLSNPISPDPYLPSPPLRLPQSCRSCLFLYICQSETCRGGRERRERERDGWLERCRWCVLDHSLCLTETWQSCCQPVRAQINLYSAVAWVGIIRVKYFVWFLCFSDKLNVCHLSENRNCSCVSNGFEILSHNSSYRLQLNVLQLNVQKGVSALFCFFVQSVRDMNIC